MSFWFKHVNIGKKPHDDDVIVDIKFKDGKIITGRVGDYNWDNSSLWFGNHIESYRLNNKRIISNG